MRARPEARSAARARRRVSAAAEASGETAGAPAASANSSPPASALDGAVPAALSSAEACFSGGISEICDRSSMRTQRAASGSHAARSEASAAGEGSEEIARRKEQAERGGLAHDVRRALRCAALHCAALRCTALHCAALRCAARCGATQDGGTRTEAREHFVQRRSNERREPENWREREAERVWLQHRGRRRPRNRARRTKRERGTSSGGGGVAGSTSDR